MDLVEMRCDHRIFRCLLCLSVCFYAVNAWGLTNVLISGTKAGLVYTDSVVKGIQRAMEECMFQFYWDRWNCPEQAFAKPKLLPANRETAFVHAITAAGVAYTLTQGCSQGDFDNCGCDDQKLRERGGSKWKWGGCSDNIGFGFGISKDYLDSKVHGMDPKAMVTKHNNHAGRQSVSKSMKRTCKCHGVSGSCSIQTCWMQLSDFPAVGTVLRNRYEKAILVDYANGIWNLGHLETKISPESSLVYLEESPDYCLENLTAGSHGTLGRECSHKVNKDGVKGRRKNSCRSLCFQCGLRVKKKLVWISVSCNCKFYWCCEVKCQTCRKKVNIHTCVTS